MPIDPILLISSVGVLLCGVIIGIAVTEGYAARSYSKGRDDAIEAIYRGKIDPSDRTRHPFDKREP
jgi:hypothetical protein